MCEVDDPEVLGLIVQHPGVDPMEIPAVARGRQSGAYRDLHPRETVTDVVVRLNLMHERDSLFASK